MQNKIVKQLVSRWSEAGIKDQVHEYLAGLRNGTLSQWPPSPFGEIDGLADFRGFQFEGASKIVGVDFMAMDASASNWQDLWLQGCSFHSVKLDHAKLQEIKDHGNSFKGCSFSSASLVGAGMGHRGSAYDGCLFDATDFRKASFIRTRFKHCQFVNAKIKGIDFYASAFDACSFAGVLDGVWFRNGLPAPSDESVFGVAQPNSMNEVSFEHAELIGVNFTGGCDLSTVLMPVGGGHRRYGQWHARLLRLADHTQQWPSTQAAEGRIFVNAYLAASRRQGWFILNTAEIEGEFGRDIAAKVFESLDAPVEP